MKVSVAISTYEAGGRGVQMITKNLSQLAVQTHPDIEIVISDHSKDNSIESVVQTFQQQVRDGISIKYIRNENDRGNSSANTNNAINHCTGDIIKIIFMDDYLINSIALATIVKYFTFSNKKWLIQSYIHTDDYKTLFNKKYPTLNRLLPVYNTVGGPSAITIHKDVTERFDPNLIWFMDCEWYARLLKFYGPPMFLYVPIMLVQMIHDQQVTKRIINQDLIDKEGQYVLEKLHLPSNSVPRSDNICGQNSCIYK